VRFIRFTRMVSPARLVPLFLKISGASALQIYNDQIFSSPAGRENDGDLARSSGRSQPDINPNVLDVDE